MQKINSKQMDWSTFGLNIKAASNPSTISPGNTANNFTTAAISFTVETACTAFVTVSIGSTSTSDYEFVPQIYLDGVQVAQMTASASVGSASSRATVRGFSAAVSLTAGAHTISPGASFSSGTSISIPATSASIAAIVLGRVTA